MPDITLCSMVYDNNQYLFLQEKVCRKLAQFDYNRLIIDCNVNQKDSNSLQGLPNTEIVDGQWINNYSGSQAHGIAVNEMLDYVNTKYCIILDLDVLPLCKKWDAEVIEELNSGIDIVGVPYNPLHEGRRILNIPTVFFMAFRTDKIKRAKLEWRTYPPFVRLRMYWLYRKLNRYIFKTNSPKFFDFEMGHLALSKIKFKRMKVRNFDMVQPWDSKSKLNFDTSYLPVDKSKIDPLSDIYPEEWHFNGKPFLTHQRKSRKSAESYNRIISANWFEIVRNYIIDNYKIDIDEI